MTISNQSDNFISVHCSYAMLEIVYDISSSVQFIGVLQTA